MRYATVFWEFCFGLLALLSILPFWVVEYPPIQDLPQHLAAIRVMHSYHDPSFGFESFFYIDLLRTQYLTYYFAAHLLSFLFDVALANKLLLSFVLVLTPYAMRHLIGQLGQNKKLAVMVFPLTYNVHLILGFFNFIAAIPLTLIGLAIAIQQRKQPMLTRGIVWAVLSVLTFYTHVVPFGFLVLGTLLICFSKDLKATAKQFIMFIPAGLSVVFWIFTSPAGQSFMSAAAVERSTSGPKPVFQPWRQAFRDIPNWFTDVLRADVDDWILKAWCALIILIMLAALGRKPEDGDASGEHASLVKNLRRRLMLLSPLAAVGYFVVPTSYDWIWPIAQRFPLLCAFLLIIVLPSPRAILGNAIFLGVVLIAAFQYHHVSVAFQTFDQKEMGQLSQALDKIPRGERVAGLIFDRYSHNIKFAPFIHSAAYYLVNRGGAVMFTFADFPASPFKFLEQNRPPKVYPRWEWMPERVNPAKDLAWYSYVLTRGGPGIIVRQKRYFRRIYNSRPWSVWKRTRPYIPVQHY